MYWERGQKDLQAEKRIVCSIEYERFKFIVPHDTYR
jgi:hypothetical protein